MNISFDSNIFFYQKSITPLVVSKYKLFVPINFAKILQSILLIFKCFYDI